MSGYIGSKSSVTLVDGYNQAEADAEFVAKSGDTMTGNVPWQVVNKPSQQEIDNYKAALGATP